MSIHQQTSGRGGKARIAPQPATAARANEEEKDTRGRAGQPSVGTDKRSASRSASPLPVPAQAPGEPPATPRNPLADAEAALRNACDLLDGFNTSAITVTNAAPPTDLLLAFQAIKQADKSGQFRLLRQSASALLSQLTSSLMLTITKLAPLCRPARIGKPSLDLARLGAREVAVWCHALSCAIGSHERGLLGTEHLKACKGELRGLCTALLTRAQALGLFKQEWSYGDVLAILALISRGTKCSLQLAGGRRESLLPMDEVMRKVFKNSLLMMGGWSNGQVGAHDGERWLDSRGLAKTMVQIGTGLKLLKPELDHEAEGKKTWRELLGELALNLLQDGAALKHFTQWTEDKLEKRLVLKEAPVDGVSLANIGTLSKDFLEAGLFDLKSQRVQGVVAALCRWICAVSGKELAKEGGQTLSNCANFLRAVCEAILKDPSLSLADAEAFGEACNHALDALAGCGALDPQAASNMGSFVKSMSKLRDAASKLPKPEWERLRLGVKALQKPVSRIAAAQAEAETVAPLCSALSYFVQRGLHTPSWQLAWLEKAFTVLNDAALKSARWPSRSREQMMKTAVERFEDCDAAASAALPLLRAWDKNQDRAIYLKAAFKLMRADESLASALQKILRQLMQWRQKRDITIEDVQQALGSDSDEAQHIPRTEVEDEGEEEEDVQAPITANTGQSARPLLLSQMQKLAATPTVTTATTTSTTTTSTTVTTLTTSSTGVPTVRVASEPEWIAPTHVGASLPPSAHALLARSALSGSGGASGAASDSEEESAKPEIPAKSGAKARHGKRKKKRYGQPVQVAAMANKPQTEAQLLQRLADLQDPDENLASTITYAGRTELALYWAVRLGRPDRVALRMGVLAFPKEGEGAIKDMLKKILEEEGFDQPMQRRALLLMLRALRQIPSALATSLEELPAWLSEAPLGVRLSFYAAGIVARPDSHAKPDSGSTVNKLLLRVLSSEDIKAREQLKSRIEAELKEPGSGNTALISAVQHGVDAVKFCLGLGSQKQQLEARNARGQTALTVAVMEAQADVVEVLLKQAGRFPQLLKNLLASAGEDLGNLLCMATTLDRTPCLELLLERASKLQMFPELLLAPDLEGLHPLQAAIKHDNQEAFHLLLQQGFQHEQQDLCNDWGMDALLCAGNVGRLEMLNSLIKKDSAEGRLETVLQRSCLTGENALQLAAKMGRDELVAALLETSQGQGAALLRCSSNGVSLLMKIARACSADTLHRAIEHFRQQGVLADALVQERDSEEDALTYAIASKDLEKVDLILWAAESVSEGNPFEIPAGLNKELKQMQGDHGELMRKLVRLHVDASRGDAQAHYGLGKMRSDGSMPTDFPRALQAYLQAAKQDHAMAYCDLGWHHFRGHFKEYPAQQCVAWLRKSIALGCARAYTWLGKCQLRGWGLPADPAAAVQSFETGSTLGDMMCQYELALILQEGSIVTADPQRARNLLKSAAAQGHGLAQFELSGVAEVNLKPNVSGEKKS